MDELISRQAAIDAVKEYFMFSPREGRECAKAIDRVPSAQPDKDLIHLQKEQAYMQGYADGQKPRKGKWIYGESEIGNDGYYCSVCGNFVPWKYGEYDIDFIKEFLFCNKCGSDMRPQYEEPEINPCRGCEDYDGKGGCKTKGGCADRRGEQTG